MIEKNIKIGNCKIGDGDPVFIIAELSANHQQDLDIAVKTIKAIKESGANAVKFQTYTAETMTMDMDDDIFRSKSPLWFGIKLFDLYQKACTPWEWHPKLKEVAEDLGLIVFSTPFDKTAVDFLDEMNMPAYKIASYEITDVPLIEYVASKGKPIIISTGVATLCDIEDALHACRCMDNNQIALLKCTSAYPTPLEDVNLRTMPNLKEIFKTVVGLSDHTLGISVPIASVALGAKIIEKHFILDRKLGGPDAAFSLEPEEFKIMVTSIREVEKASGGINYELTETMLKSRRSARSLFVVQDMKAGEIFTEENIRSIRPYYGLSPKYLKDILGKKASKNIKGGTPMQWDLLACD